MMSGKRQPGLEMCISIANAFEMRPEEVLYRAGLLPSPPPPVRGEEQALRFFRRLTTQARDYVLTTLAALASREPSVIAEERAEYQARPRNLGEQLAQWIDQELDTMPLDDQEKFWEFMKNKRKRQEGENGAPGNVETDP